MKLKRRTAGGTSRREILKYGLYGSLAPSLAGALWLSGCERKRHKKRPDVLLISVDTLRADHLGCYGYYRNTSPNIDRFAREGLLFKNCFSHAPETRPSFASILSGFLPHEARVLENVPLPAELQTLAEILRGEGHRTAAVVSNFVLQKRNVWKQGFAIKIQFEML